ncbi:MAG: cadherin domain-containing protein, partial [Planctomycetota bacterium]|nr:cadherin domain-containing protein [Planctomycetota bacterium]
MNHLNPSVGMRWIGRSNGDNSGVGLEWLEARLLLAAPVVTTTVADLAYTENDGAVVVDGGLTVTDADSTDLVSATITISVSYTTGQDVLSFTDQLGITGIWSAVTGVLSLTGTVSVANYQTALQSVTYTNTSESPTTATRTVSFVVNDGTAPSAPATRNITVAAVNDPPVVADQSFDVDENAALTTAVGTVVATDPDAGEVLSYAITAGNTGGAFAIDSATGEITVAGALDHETLGVYSLTVEVTDDGTPGLSDTATVTVNVTDVNEAPVVADQSFDVDENAALTTAVGTVVATDVDDGAVLSYAITAGNTGGAFAIDSGTGEITVAGALDHETLGVY